MSDAATSRQHFSLGTHALKQRDPTRAQAHFLAAHTLASPLVSGHALRGMAQACLQQGDSTQALALLDMARRAYLLCEDSEHLLHGEPTVLVKDAVEGRATCWVMQVDVHLQDRDFEQAQAALDAAYPLYRDLPERRSQADLWAATARMAQHFRRWATAGVAWQKVIATAEAHQDLALAASAHLWLAEVRLRDADLTGVDTSLETVEPWVEDLEDPDLRARMHSTRAALYAYRAEYEAAWDVALDALDAVSAHDASSLADTIRLRMASIARYARPAECVPMLQEVMNAQLEDPSADVLSQLSRRAAEVALAHHRFSTALLIATVAEVWSVEPHAARLLQVRALMALEEADAAAWLADYVARSVGDAYPTAIALAKALEDHLPTTEEIGFERVTTEALTRRDRATEHWAAEAGMSWDAATPSLTLARLLEQLAEPAGAAHAAQTLGDVDEHPMLVWRDQSGLERTLQLPEGVTTVGRSLANGVPVSWDPDLSTAHFSLHRTATRVRIRDLDSSGGTQVDGQPLTEEQELSPDQTIRAGQSEFTLAYRRALGTAPTAAAVVAIPVSR